jgi:tetratricopeptide (TPR) repeat protein
MTAWAAALLALAVPAQGFWGTGAETVNALEADYNAGRYEAVIARLDPAGLQKLRGDSLRRGYLLLGASYERTGRADKSLSVYQVAVRIFPWNKELLIELAGLLHKAGLEEQAQPLYEKLVRIDPENPYGHLGLEIGRAHV